MSAPNNVNVNVSHSNCDFLARHKSSVFDGARPEAPERAETDEQEEFRKRRLMQRLEPGGRQEGSFARFFTNANICQQLSSFPL